MLDSLWPLLPAQVCRASLQAYQITRLSREEETIPHQHTGTHRDNKKVYFQKRELHEGERNEDTREGGASGPEDEANDQPSLSARAGPPGAALVMYEKRVRKPEQKDILMVVEREERGSERRQQKSSYTRQLRAAAISRQEASLHDPTQTGEHIKTHKDSQCQVGRRCRSKCPETQRNVVESFKPDRCEVNAWYLGQFYIAQIPSCWSKFAMPSTKEFILQNMIGMCVRKKIK
ncbi:hypothetical protein KCU83_g88, partial [Aureobasidium melanogenum]